MTVYIYGYKYSVNDRDVFEWRMLANITQEPYFMLYGEVYAPRIDPCVDEHFNNIDCNPGSWFVPVWMTVYLLGML